VVLRGTSWDGSLEKHIMGSLNVCTAPSKNIRFVKWRRMKKSEHVELMREIEVCTGETGVKDIIRKNQT
jgi:hypothetical protein